MANDFTRNIKHLTTEQISDNFLNNFLDTNDIVSDDKNNYIKKPNEIMHCLTDNLKGIYTNTSSVLEIENNNDNNYAIISLNILKLSESLTNEYSNIITYTILNNENVMCGLLEINISEKTIHMIFNDSYDYILDNNMIMFKLHCRGGVKSFNYLMEIDKINNILFFEKEQTIKLSFTNNGNNAYFKFEKMILDKEVIHYPKISNLSSEWVVMINNLYLKDKAV